MRDDTGYVTELRQRENSAHDANASRMSPEAKARHFPTRYARPVPREPVKASDQTQPLRRQIALLEGRIDELKQENARLTVLAAQNGTIAGDKPGPWIVSVMEEFCQQMNAAGMRIGDEEWSLVLLRSPRKSHPVSHPRHVCMWLVRTLDSSHSYPQIGHEFGGRDHTSVLHAVKHASKVMESNPALLQVATAVLRKFGVVLARLEAQP